MGISALKTVQEILNHREIDENPLKNSNLGLYFLSISQNIYNIF